MSEVPAVSLANYHFYEIAAIDEIAVGERIFFEIGDLPIVLFNVGGEFYAIGDVCTHDNGPLGEGEIDGYQVICPRHGARFDMRTGKAVKLPAVRPTPWYPVRIVDGTKIEIGIPK